MFYGFSCIVILLVLYLFFSEQTYKKHIRFWSHSLDSLFEFRVGKTHSSKLGQTRRWWLLESPGIKTNKSLEQKGVNACTMRSCSPKGIMTSWLLNLESHYYSLFESKLAFFSSLSPTIAFGRLLTPLRKIENKNKFLVLLSAIAGRGWRWEAAACDDFEPSSSRSWFGRLSLRAGGPALVTHHGEVKWNCAGG